MVQDLIEKAENLASALHDREGLLEREKDVSNMYHQLYKENESKLRRRQLEMVQSSRK